jgi:signal transduction histidine kinase/DNA-binding response OmpR family regulator
MSLRERLTLSIITILILFSINVGTDSWSNHARRSNLDSLQASVSGQLLASKIKKNLEDLHKAVLLLGSLRSTLQENLTPQEIAQAMSEINNLQADIQQLGTVSNDQSYQDLKRSYLNLLPLWKKFYRSYNDRSYNHYEESDIRELLYRQVLNDLELQRKALVEMADREAVEINDIEEVTNRITVVVFIISIIFTIGLGVFLIRYTNREFRRLKVGANIIGGGNLDYRIPITTRDELGAVGESFNAMSAKLNHAIKEVRLAKENADTANRAKSNFLANMSHELRTPLNAIIGYSEMMLEDLEIGEIDQEEQKEDLGKVLYAGKHLLNQINDVLDFSKIETGKMTVYNEEFSVAEVLQEVITTISPLAQKSGNILNFQPPEQLPPLYSDITKFRQIFLNLLSNACKFTQNGCIELRIDVNKETQSIKFSVSDNGIGMSAEQTAIVFDAFIQADSSTTRKYGGTGLGLALCKEYCRLMGADIDVESAENVGTTFTVSFQLKTETDTESNKTNALSVATPVIKSRRDRPLILVIDDDPVALALAERNLSKDNYDVLLSQSGMQGITLAENHQPDMILLDIMMPVTDGWAVLSALKENTATQAIPIIFLTMMDKQTAEIDSNAIDCIKKPVNWEKLRQRIAEHRKQPLLGKLLLLDKKSRQRDMMINGLNRKGWRVLCCNTPQQAKRLLSLQPIQGIIVAEEMVSQHNIQLANWLPEDSEIPCLIINDRNRNVSQHIGFQQMAREEVLNKTNMDQFQSGTQ